MSEDITLTIAGRLLDGFGKNGLPEDGLRNVDQSLVKTALLYSQAVSLKRIADALEKRASGVLPSPPKDGE